MRPVFFLVVVSHSSFLLVLFLFLYNICMDEITIAWRRTEWVAMLEGKSPLQIDVLRDRFFKQEEKEEKDEKERREMGEKAD